MQEHAGVTYGHLRPSTDAGGQEPPTCLVILVTVATWTCLGRQWQALVCTSAAGTAAACKRDLDILGCTWIA
jgi:hypothetical protein